MTDKLKPVAYIDTASEATWSYDEFQRVPKRGKMLASGEVISLYAIPQGYSLVPDEPTDKILYAMFNSYIDAGSTEDIYNAMLKAAKEDA